MEWAIVVAWTILQPVGCALEKALGARATPHLYKPDHADYYGTGLIQAVVTIETIIWAVGIWVLWP